MVWVLKGGKGTVLEILVIEQGVEGVPSWPRRRARFCPTVWVTSGQGVTSAQVVLLVSKPTAAHRHSIAQY